LLLEKEIIAFHSDLHNVDVREIKPQSKHSKTNLHSIVLPFISRCKPPSSVGTTFGHIV
jgi:hypothetical protein